MGRSSAVRPYVRSQRVVEVAAVSGSPDPKPVRRIVASPAEWEAIAEAKQGPCRICRRVESNGSVHSKIQLHHLIRRSQGGDDVPDNIVPLCGECHRRLHDGRLVSLRLTAAEKAYLRSRGRA